MKQDTYDYLSMLAYAYLRHDRVGSAITVLEAMASLTPQDDWTHRTLAYAYLRNGEWQACLDKIEAASNFDAADKSDRVLRVRALWGLGRRDEARQILEQTHGKLR